MIVCYNISEGREGKGPGCVMCYVKGGCQGKKWEIGRKAILHIYHRN